MRRNTCSAAIIEEARRLSSFLVEIERGLCSGDVDLSLHRVSERYGIEESALRSLRYRWRDLQDVRASVLERLREAYEEVYERQRRFAQIEIEIDRLIRPPEPENVPEQEPIQEELPL